MWQDLKEGKDCKVRFEEIAAILEDERKKKEMFAAQSNMLKETAHSLEQEKQAQQERIRVMESELHKTVGELKSTQMELGKVIKLYDVAKEDKLELEKRAKLFKQQYEELKLRMKESERKLAEERRKAEEEKLVKERRREEERKAEEERKRREGGERAEEKTFTVGGVLFKMIRVEGGSFMMGAPDNDSDAHDDEKPQHRVMLSDCYIGETQVTQALWEAVMGDNPSDWKGDSLPVEMVSWEDCQEFIRILTKRQVRHSGCQLRQNGNTQPVAGGRVKASSMQVVMILTRWLGMLRTAEIKRIP